MLLVSPGKGRALSVPVLKGCGALALGFICLRYGLTFTTFERVSVTLFALLVLALAASELRAIYTTADHLFVRSPFSTRALPLASLAFGIRVALSSRSGASYIIYALGGADSVDLTSTRNRMRADQLKSKLASALLAGRLSSERARPSELEILRRETAWQTEIAQTTAILDAYYRSPLVRRLPYFIALVVLVTAVCVALFLHTGD